MNKNIFLRALLASSILYIGFVVTPTSARAELNVDCTQFDASILDDSSPDSIKSFAKNAKRFCETTKKLPEDIYGGTVTSFNTDLLAWLQSPSAENKAFVHNTLNDEMEIGGKKVTIDNAITAIDTLNPAATKNIDTNRLLGLLVKRGIELKKENGSNLKTFKATFFGDHSIVALRKQFNIIADQSTPPQEQSSFSPPRNNTTNVENSKFENTDQTPASEGTGETPVKEVKNSAKNFDVISFLSPGYFALLGCFLLLVMAILQWLQISSLKKQVEQLSSANAQLKNYPDSLLNGFHTKFVKPLQSDVGKLKKDVQRVEDNLRFLDRQRQAEPQVPYQSQSSDSAAYYSSHVPSGPDPFQILSTFLQNPPGALEQYPNVKLKAERTNQQARRNDPSAPLELEDAGGSSQAFYYGFELPSEQYAVVPGLQHTYNDSLLQMQGLDRIYEIMTISDKQKGKVQTIDTPAIMKRDGSGWQLLQKGRLTLSV